MKLAWVSLIVLVFLAGGCASGPKTNVKSIDWGSRIGTYTFEEALAELGQPDVMGESSEGKIAEWVLRRSPDVSFGIGFGHICRMSPSPHRLVDFCENFLK